MEGIAVILMPHVLTQSVTYCMNYCVREHVGCITAGASVLEWKVIPYSALTRVVVGDKTASSIA